MSLSEVRKEIYDYHRKNYAYLFKWPWYSYRRYKMALYIESAGLMAFVLLRTNVSPNAVTLFYIGLSALSALLLAIPARPAALAAILIIFLKPAIDSVDGSMARIKNMRSVSGDILDSYSAALDWVFLWTSLGFYLGNFTNPVFYYITPIIPAIFAGDIYASALERFVYHYFTKKELRSPGKAENVGLKSNNVSLSRRIKGFIDVVFQQNARTVDLICLAALIELCSPVRILWIFYSSFLVWKVFTFAMRLYMAAFKGWGEAELDNLQRTIYG